MTKQYALEISDLQIELFFTLLDVDDSGFLEPEEFVDLIATRQSFGTSQPKGPEINLLTEGLKLIVNGAMEKLGMDPYFSAKEVAKPQVVAQSDLD